MLLYKYTAINDKSKTSLINKYFWCSRLEKLNGSLLKESLDWQHEGNKNCKLYYCDDVLDSITFGFNASEKEIEDIKNIVKSSYMNASDVRFYKVVPNYQTKTLEKIVCS